MATVLDVMCECGKVMIRVESMRWWRCPNGHRPISECEAATKSLGPFSAAADRYFAAKNAPVTMPIPGPYPKPIKPAPLPRAVVVRRSW